MCLRISSEKFNCSCCFSSYDDNDCPKISLIVNYVKDKTEGKQSDQHSNIAGSTTYNIKHLKIKNLIPAMNPQCVIFSLLF